MVFRNFLVVTVIFTVWFTIYSECLPVYPLNYNTLPGQSPNLYANQYPYNNAYPYNNQLYYDPDGKWPAYGWDAPGNYHQSGKVNSDAFLTPSNVPRWYNQPDGGRGLQGTQGWLWPLFYGKR